MYRELPPEARLRELQQHDIITVIVDYRTRMLSEGDAESRKTSSLNAVLSSWIRFDGKSIKPAPQTDGDPRIAGTYNSQYRAESDVELRDTLTLPHRGPDHRNPPQRQPVHRRQLEHPEQRRALADLPLRRGAPRVDPARPHRGERLDRQPRHREEGRGPGPRRLRPRVVCSSGTTSTSRSEGERCGSSALRFADSSRRELNGSLNVHETLTTLLTGRVAWRPRRSRRASPTTASARTVLRNICRVKGQEENVLRGVGLVVGLAGTGEAADPATMRALARAMEIMGVPDPRDAAGAARRAEGPREDQERRAGDGHGPRAGDRRPPRRQARLLCERHQRQEPCRRSPGVRRAAGPNTQDKRVLRPVRRRRPPGRPDQPMVGVVTGGCQMEEDVFTPFVHDGRITLILDEHHANFQTATEVVESIYAQYSQRGGRLRPGDQRLEHRRAGAGRVPERPRGVRRRHCSKRRSTRPSPKPAS